MEEEAEDAIVEKVDIFHKINNVQIETLVSFAERRDIGVTLAHKQRSELSRQIERRGVRATGFLSLHQISIIFLSFLTLLSAMKKCLLMFSIGLIILYL